MVRPRVSVILPAYNRLAYLRMAIDSVRAQTLAGWELIVADDGSDAETRAYLAQLDEARMRVLFLEHSGNPARVRNAAIGKATGDFLAFIDSDDLWTPAKLERQLAAMSRTPARRWSYSQVRRIDGSGNEASADGVATWRAFEGDIVEPLLRIDALLATPAVVAERALVLAAGAFDEHQRFCEDYDLWLRLALLSEVTAVAEPLACVRVHADNYSRDRAGAYLGWVQLYERYAAHLADPERVRICRERGSECALALAAAYGRAGKPRLAMDALAYSARQGWRHPRWWPRAAWALAAALLPRRARD
jgi:glycosyltransferase involved in cell wall biosynthesis